MAGSPSPILQAGGALPAVLLCGLRLDIPIAGEVQNLLPFHVSRARLVV